ncbi:MAG: ATP-dependent DNA helicase RecG [Actinomycetota bacterium]
MTAKEPLLLYAPERLEVPVRYVKGVGPGGEKILFSSKFGIRTVQDLLQHYPRRHLDFSETRTIREVGVGDEVTIIGEVRKVVSPPRPGGTRRVPRRAKLPLKVMLDDGTSVLALVFFNQPWRARQLAVGTTVAAKGKVSNFRGARQMSAPLIDVITGPDEIVHIVPQYPATAEIHTAWLRKIIKAALDTYSPLSDPLPEDLRTRHRLMDRTSAFAAYHFPTRMAEKWEARRRLVFDELFTLQTGLAYRKRRLERQEVGISQRVHGEMTGRFLETLPFELTGAQRRAIKEIEADLERSVPMHRLLQGEVGSGKTVVALLAALVAVQGGYQAAIMAPTEVLACQHFLNAAALLEGLGSSAEMQGGQLELFGGPRTAPLVLLTGSVGSARRRSALARIATGEAGIVVGTHALIQEGVSFSNLGLAVIDEQHRFGVRQRIDLRAKGREGVTPDVLIMTATPIPRTLALTLYGDLDVSVLDELPRGRPPVKTRVIDEAGRDAAYDLVRREVKAGRQAYVITPLVDESDKLEIKSAEAEAERLGCEVFPDLRVGMLHGRMRPAQKESAMASFRRGDIDVLISTTVIEVGVDVANATVMLIEDAERFGLSQLHQLRGRIGRGEHPSTCLLFSSVLELPEEERRAARERLEAVAATNDGFELAEKDLEIRGSGTILGERQAGFSDLRITHLVRDVDILKRARDEAFTLIEADPDLSGSPLIRLEMEGRFADRLDWLFHS